MSLFSDECSNCGSKEHATSECPHGIFSSKCAHCGSVDHASSDCPHGIFSSKCSNCGSTEHASSDCPHGIFSSKCSNCGSTEHESSDCPHGIFSSECANCGSRAHATSDCPHGIFSSRSRCAHCGSRDHSTRQCPLREESDDENDYSGIWGFVVLAILALVVWLVFALVIPLTILNVSAIALFASLIWKKWNVHFLWTSVAGLPLGILNYNLEWFTNSLSNKFDMGSTIPWLYALNIVAGLVSAYLLVRDHIRVKMPERLAAMEPRKKDYLLIASLAAVGIIIGGLQISSDGTAYASSTYSQPTDSYTSPPRQSTSSTASSDQRRTSGTTSQGTSGNSTFKPFYITIAVAVNSKNQARSAAADLKRKGYQSGYLWIPDYTSLSGAQSYAVYLGPFATQRACEVATEDYRKIVPSAYGTLVSHGKKRIQINGIGKVIEKDVSDGPARCNSDVRSGDEVVYITGDNLRVRMEPDASNEISMLFRLNKQDAAKVLDRTTNAKGELWYKICHDGRAGWVIARYADLRRVR